LTHNLFFLFALRRELEPFRRSFPAQWRQEGAPCTAWVVAPAPRSPGPACSFPAYRIVHCGMGDAGVEQTLPWVLSQQPSAVILAGFSGSLTPDLTVGDLVLATEVRTGAGTIFPVTLPLVNSTRAGPLLAVERFILARTEKQELHAATGALAVDMESALVAQRCADAGIPFGCLRVISDGLAADLPPELETVTCGERVRLWPLLKALCRRPGLVWDLWHLAKATRIAARNLAAGLHEALRSLRPEQRDGPAPGGR
jgi:nucleoside phosphorylase